MKTTPYPVRIPRHLLELADLRAAEEQIDRSTALRQLLHAGAVTYARTNRRFRTAIRTCRGFSRSGADTGAEVLRRWSDHWQRALGLDPLRLLGTTPAGTSRSGSTTRSSTPSSRSTSRRPESGATLVP